MSWKFRGSCRFEVLKFLENDWCHICGLRSDHHVRIWYHTNAEHPDEDKPWKKDVRMCLGCLEVFSEEIRHELQLGVIKKSKLEN